MSSFIWWVVGVLGVGGALFAAAVIILGWPVLIAFAETKLGKIVIGIGTVGIGLVGLYLKGKSAGEAAQKAKQESDDAAFLQKQRQNADDVGRLSDAQLDNELLDKRPK